MLFRILIASSIAGKSFKLIGPTCEAEAEALYFTNFPFLIGCTGGLVVRALDFHYLIILILRLRVRGSIATLNLRLLVRGSDFFIFFGCSQADPID